MTAPDTIGPDAMCPGTRDPGFAATGDVPPEAYAAALAGFDAMTVHRLAALLRHHEPAHAWAVACGEVPVGGLVGRVLADREVRAAWARSAALRPPQQVWDDLQRTGTITLVIGGAGYPAILANDQLAPPVLFARGDLSLLGGRRVAIVGTRNATASGRATARDIAADLAASGVHVVSGLARGIDGVAHGAVIAAEAPGRPVAVVASGPDVVYPAEHRALWEGVCNCGLLLSEVPPGIGPVAYRFPLRNRIIAALSEVVVVVESRERGGSLSTAAEALDRGIPLAAVPGPPTNRAAAGTNNLLRDGASPVMDAGDVLALLSLDHRRAVPAPDLRPRPRPDDVVVYDALRDGPRTIDGIALVCALPLVEAAMRLARLEHQGWVGGTDGWYELIGSPLR